MNDERKSLMSELQQLGLTMDDLREYLDTHPYDDFVISRFNETAQLYHQKMLQWSERYGPLTQRCMSGDDSCWAWALNDFPWDE